MSEVRTVFINWPIDGVEHDMLVKEQSSFTNLQVDDFGLEQQPPNANVPQFFMVTKLPKQSTAASSSAAAASSAEPGLPSGSDSITGMGDEEKKEPVMQQTV